MAIKYRVIKRKNNIGGKKDVYILHAIKSGEINLERLAYEISNQCTASEADVWAVLVALGNQLRFHLGEGHTVNMENIGRFSIGFRCPAKENPEDLKPSDIKQFHINYQPSGRLKKWLKGGLALRKDRRKKWVKCNVISPFSIPFKSDPYKNHCYNVNILWLRPWPLK